MKPKQLPSQELLHEQFDYHPDGYLVWLQSRGGVKVGSMAGRFNVKGYSEISVKGVRYLTHRLIYAWHHGTCPDEIDHINRNSRDNRIENLRPATRSENMSNSVKRRVPTTGCRNVRFTAKGNFQVHIRANGMDYSKTFKTLAEAAKHAKEVKKQFHGNFAVNETA